MTANDFIVKQLGPKALYTPWLTSDVTSMMRQYNDQETAALRKELEEAKVSAITACALKDEVIKIQKSNTAKLVEALRGAQNYIIYAKDEFKLSDAGQSLTEIREALAPFENDKTQQS